MEKRIKEKRVGFWVEPEFLEKFDEACKKDQRDRSSGLRVAMLDYIRKILGKEENG